MVMPAEMTELLTKRRTGLLTGFFSSKTKRKFDAILVLKDDFTMGFEFPEAGAASGAALKVLGAPCPKCKGELRHVGGDKPRYACATGDFTLWATIAGRTLSEREALTLVRTGSLSPVSGFVSAAKKTKFAAGLRLEADTGKVSFVFVDN